MTFPPGLEMGGLQRRWRGNSNPLRSASGAGLVRTSWTVERGRTTLTSEKKAELDSCQTLLVDLHFPSTRRRSCCGSLQAEMALSQRQYECKAYGMVIERDLNTACNMDGLLVGADGADLMLETTASSVRNHACGEVVRPGFQAAFAEGRTEPQSTLSRFG